VIEEEEEEGDDDGDDLMSWTEPIDIFSATR